MTPEIKRKLEEMSVGYSLDEVNPRHRVDFMAGALASWELAVKDTRAKFEFYGTDGCSKCDDGRISMYRECDRCLECQRKYGCKHRPRNQNG